MLVPEGVYKISSIFLKDNLTLELAKGAVLSAFTDREKFPVLPGEIESYDETAQYNLGSWEGNPLDMFSAIVCGINVENVVKERLTAVPILRTGGRTARSGIRHGAQDCSLSITAKM